MISNIHCDEVRRVINGADSKQIWPRVQIERSIGATLSSEC